MPRMEQLPPAVKALGSLTGTAEPHRRCSFAAKLKAQDKLLDKIQPQKDRWAFSSRLQRWSNILTAASEFRLCLELNIECRKSG
ncbi:hypothetical protein MHYP_G00062620 [Metynnis hypsauchen]